MVELVDTQRSGRCGRKPVRVQISLSPQEKTSVSLLLHDGEPLSFLEHGPYPYSESLCQEEAPSFRNFFRCLIFFRNANLFCFSVYEAHQKRSLS